MSSIGSPIDASLLQAAQAQQTAAKARDKERAATESGRRFKDIVELRVSGVEDETALRRVPENDSEQAQSEQQAKRQAPDQGPNEEEQAPRIDLQA